MGHQSSAHDQHLLLPAGEIAGRLIPEPLEHREVAVDHVQISLEVGTVPGDVCPRPEVLLHREVDQGSPSFEYLDDALPGDGFRVAVLDPLPFKLDAPICDSAVL